MTPDEDDAFDAVTDLTCAIAEQLDGADLPTALAALSNVTSGLICMASDGSMSHAMAGAKMQNDALRQLVRIYMKDRASPLQ